MLSLIIPVYKSDEGLPTLFVALEHLQAECKNILTDELEVVFVVDGSPDRSHEIINDHLSFFGFKSQLVLLSRNFGSFAAIRAGLELSNGDLFAVMAADLQEPPNLILEFFKELKKGSADIVVGQRRSRQDPFLNSLSSSIFWGFYRRYVVKDIPKGGVDIFGCNKIFRNHLLELKESHSSLVGLIYWLGFKRLEIPYQRQLRIHGKSAWSFKNKIKYMLDSLFAFTDLPIRFLIAIGTFGIFISILLAIVVLILRLFSFIDVPGYSATILTITFFGGLNSFGIGIVGNYTWRAYENSKHRPLSVISSSEKNY